MFDLDPLRDWDELTRLQGKLAVDLLRSKQAVRRKVRRKLQERGLGLDIGPRRETNLGLRRCVHPSDVEGRKPGDRLGSMRGLT